MRFPDGRITGEAFVEITVENDLATALAKHKVRFSPAIFIVLLIKSHAILIGVDGQPLH